MNRPLPCWFNSLARMLEGGEEMKNHEVKGEEKSEGEIEESGEQEGFRNWEAKNGENANKSSVFERLQEIKAQMNEIFDSVTTVKKAYSKIQEAHCPWDPEKIRLADMMMVAELGKLGRLKERSRRGGGGGRRDPGGTVTGAFFAETVAPYEVAMEELKLEIKVKEVEIDSLKEKLRNSTSGKKGRSSYHRRLSCNQVQVASVPSTEQFELCMTQVKEKSKTLTALFLSFMSTTQCDIVPIFWSEENGNGSQMTADTTQHTRYALESYICCKIFQGFENETFYLDGSLSSLINPENFRRDCFTQFRDMKTMDPSELLGILPTCHFGQFCWKKFLAILQPKMEESLFGNLDQRHLVLAQIHPRTEFYREFLALAKAVWLLHLLAFSFDPPPCHFHASNGADFHSDYMESVVKFIGKRMPPNLIVGFPVTPGFKLRNGSIIKARVFPVHRT